MTVGRMDGQQGGWMDWISDANIENPHSETETETETNGRKDREGVENR